MAKMLLSEADGHRPQAGGSSSQPTVLLAIKPRLVTQFFLNPMLARLTEVCELLVSPTPEDHLSTAVRPLLERAQIIVTGWGSGRVDDDVLERAPKLRAVIHSAGSVREIIDPAIYRSGIEVSSQAWVNAVPVAEYTLAMILLAGKGVGHAEQTYRDGRTLPPPVELLEGYGNYGNAVGIIGASMVGRRVIDLLAPFDLQVFIADPYLGAREARHLGVSLVDLPTLMSLSNIVSLHAPLLDSTRKMINASMLALLPDGATFINTARGGLVDESALVDQLATGRIRAVLDVTDPGTPHPTHPFWSLPGLTLTPHIAGAFGNELRRLGESVVDEVLRVVRGESLKHPVTAETFSIRA